MARHETEMHRQRRQARELVSDLWWFIENADALPMDERNMRFFALRERVRTQPPCNQGLFADHSQMDLQDRRDI